MVPTQDKITANGHSQNKQRHIDICRHAWYLRVGKQFRIFMYKLDYVGHAQMDERIASVWYVVSKWTCMLCDIHLVCFCFETRARLCKYTPKHPSCPVCPQSLRVALVFLISTPPCFSWLHCQNSCLVSAHSITPSCVSLRQSHLLFLPVATAVPPVLL